MKNTFLVTTLALVAFAFSSLGAEELPPLSIVQNDVLIMKLDGKRVPGIIQEIRADGSIVFIEIGRSAPLVFTKDQYLSYESRQDANQAVLKRGRILLARKDLLGVRQAILWGTENDATASSLILALETMTAHPGETEIGGITLTLLEQAGRSDEREGIARALLAANPRYEPAFAVLAQVLQAKNASADLIGLTDAFLAKMPTSQVANRIKAEIAEKSGDVRGAQEAFRKGWKLHQDMDAALGYARTSLRLGAYDQALEGANALADANKHVAEARAIAGTVKVGKGSLEDARSALTAAVADADLGEPYLGWARYNLGLVEYRLGDTAAAQRRWAEDNSPIAQLALAIVEKKPFAGEATLTDPGVRAIARELNACIALERGQADRALAGLDVQSNARHQFLAQIAQVLKTAGGEGALRQLAAVDSVESLRWRAYGHILAQEWSNAEAVLRQLPADDGYAAVYRIYVAAAQKDLVRAKDLFRTLSQANNAPADYVAVLAAEYAADNDEVLTEDFAWVDGDQLASGWQIEAVETNIRVHVKDGRLVLEGQQSAAPQPVSHAWRLVAADRIRLIALTVDISAISTAQVGLEVMDENRNNGVALGILADNKLGYRIRTEQVWGEWQPLPLRSEGTKPTLRLELNAGRVFAVAADNPAQRHALGEARLPTTGFLSVGPFGQAEPGTTWRLAAERLELQMKAGARNTR